MENIKGLKIGDTTATARVTPTGNTGSASTGAGYNDSTYARREKSSVRGMDFDGSGMLVLNSNQGSDYVKRLSTEILNSYKLPAGNTPKIHALDKEVLGNMAYSLIVISKMTGDIVHYHTLILVATGNKPMTAQEMSHEINRPRNPHQQELGIYTPDDTLDEYIHEKIITILVQEYGRDATYLSADGTVVPANAIVDQQLATVLAAIGYNAVNVDAEITSGTSADLNLAVALGNSNNKVLRIETNMLKQTVSDEVTKPLRQDFAVDLTQVDVSSKFVSINLQNSKRVLTSARGFIDAIPAAVEVPVGPGYAPIKKVRLHPHIIISSVEVAVPTIGFTLLGIASAMVMTSPEMYLGAMMPSADGIHNIGNANVMTNIEDSPSMIGNPINLADKAITTNEIYDTLRDMFTQRPIVSLDIENYGPQTYYNSVFATAANGNIPPEERAAAAAEIVKAANTLTDGHFPADFPINRIFAFDGVLVPTGTWQHKSGERDIRDVDLAYLADKVDIASLNKWGNSNFPGADGHGDPYLFKAELIASVIGDAEMASKALRTTLSSEFTTALSNSVTAAGLSTTYDPAVVFNESYNLGNVGNLLANAGFSGGMGYMRPAGVNGSNFTYNGYGMMGHNRYQQ